MRREGEQDPIRCSPNVWDWLENILRLQCGNNERPKQHDILPILLILLCSGNTALVGRDGRRVPVSPCLAATHKTVRYGIDGVDEASTVVLG
jgi:hypothetical protein